MLYHSTGGDPPKAEGSFKRACRWQLAGPEIAPGPQFNPTAVADYIHRSSYSPANGTEKKSSVNVLATELRNHLLYLGWKIEYANDRNSAGKEIRRLRYISPYGGNCYYSLPRVCECLKEEECKNLCAPESHALLPPTIEEQPPLIEAVPENPPPRRTVVSVEPEYCPRAVRDWYVLGEYPKQSSGDKDKTLKAKKHLAAVGWTFWYAYKNDRQELRYNSPAGKCFNSLRTACKHCLEQGGDIYRMDASGCVEAESGGQVLGALEQTSSSIQPQNHVSFRVEPEVDSVVGLTLERKRKLRDTSSRKKKKKKKTMKKLLSGGARPAGMVAIRSSSNHNPRTVLSWLIDNNVLMSRAKVEYRSRKDKHRMAAGKITRDGIKCSCCQEIFTLTRFEAHAGSTYHRPAANIFLEDGRSLLDCQMQAMSNNDGGNRFPSKSKCSTKKRVQHQHQSDYVCSICLRGGDLILCDQCPSTFHKNCVGLKDVPDGNWFCPFCCCRICRQRELSGDIVNNLLSCSQCEHQYHGCCLREKGIALLGTNCGENWFCSESCKKIFVSLREIVGKTVSLDSNFSWTLLRTNKYDQTDQGGIDIEVGAENDSKLNVATGVMHECFEPVQEAFTGRDLAEDVIFSNCSRLKRLNFRRFHTVILGREDEVISVATVRVHDNKVAEVPLVATRFRYRRQGMCRILMQELEKKLITLGIERLVLPAAQSVLKTWTGPFGFSETTDPDRLELLDYTFLDFQGTVMCQKLLMQPTSTESERTHDIEYVGDGDVKELHELAPLECKNNSGSCYIQYAGGSHMKEFKEPCLLECRPLECEVSAESSIEDAGANYMKETQEPALPKCKPFGSQISAKCSFQVTRQEMEFQGPSPPRSLNFRIKLKRGSTTLDTDCEVSQSNVTTHHECNKRLKISGTTRVQPRLVPPYMRPS